MLGRDNKPTELSTSICLPPLQVFLSTQEFIAPPDPIKLLLINKKSVFAKIYSNVRPSAEKKPKTKQKNYLNFQLIRSYQSTCLLILKNVYIEKILKTYKRKKGKRLAESSIAYFEYDPLYP